MKSKFFEYFFIEFMVKKSWEKNRMVYEQKSLLEREKRRGSGTRLKRDSIHGFDSKKYNKSSRGLPVWEEEEEEVTRKRKNVSDSKQWPEKNNRKKWHFAYNNKKEEKAKKKYYNF